MVEGGPSRTGGGGWIATRPPLDGPSRLRILVGTIAILVAVVSSLALLNLLVVEPVVGDGAGNTGGQPGGTIDDPGTTGQPNEGGDSGEGDGGQPGSKANPCTTAKSWVGGSAVTFTVLSLALWVLSVWWRQSRQTRVMNGWAITALVFTLVAATLLFSWWLVVKICNLDIFDLKACREIARSLLGAFLGFGIPGLGLIGFAIAKKRQGGRFMGIWSGAGFVFLYLAILSMVGWLVADDFCDRRFEPPDPDDIPNPDDPGGDDPGGDSGNGGEGGNTGEPGGSNPGGNNGGGNNPTGGGGGSRGGGGGGGGLPTLTAPQISPVMLLVLLGMAAVLVIIVLAVRTRHNPAMNLGGGHEEIAIEDRGTLLALLKRTDLQSDDQVVASYRSYLGWATVRGVGKYPHETPREHGQRVTYELDLPWQQTEPLLEAYTHVRLGHEELDEQLRQAAVAFAEGIRDGAIRPGRPFAVPADAKAKKSPAKEES